MKRIVSALTVLALLFACTPEENNPGGNDNNGKDNGGNKEVVATAIKLNKNDLILEKGGNETLTVTFTPSNVTNKNLTWVSSNKSIAEVTDGIVVGVEVGTTEIVVKNGDLTDKCTVTVVIAAKSITLNKESLSFKALNQTETLTATVDPASTTDTVEWTSSDPNVAAVSSEGVVTSVAPGAAEITVSCGKASAKCSVTVEVAATAISLSKNSLSLRVGDSETLTATVEPDNTTDKLEWSSSSEEIASVKDGVVKAVALGTATITAKAGPHTATCDVIVEIPPYTAMAGDAIDLGLSVKWSSTNLGATSPTGNGDYFAWGEIAPKDDYSFASYKFYSIEGGNLIKITKYNYYSSFGIVDNKTEFKDYDYEDDVARQALGGKWRVPTESEWTELINNCTWTWVTNYNGTGVNGRLVTASNGNSIFLPAASFWIDTTFCYDYVGICGNYWSSSLVMGKPEYAYTGNAWGVYISSDEFYMFGQRELGFSIRPVSE